MAKVKQAAAELNPDNNALLGSHLSSIISKLSITNPEFQFKTIEQAIEVGNSWFESKDYARAEYSYAAGLKLAMDGKNKEKSIDEQIKLVQLIAETYMARKLSEGYTKATSLYNYALNLCKQNNKPLEQENKILEKLKDIEIDFVKLIQGNAAYTSQYFNSTYKLYLDLLTAIRINAKEELAELDDEYNLDKAKMPGTGEGWNEEYKEELFRGKAEGIRKLFGTINDDMKGLISTMMDECHQVIGPAPCEYAIIGLGSMARGEMTPYSDFEFGILVADEGYKEYFYNLTNLLYFKVINLGETILPSMTIPSLYDYKAKNPEERWFYDEVTPRGFAFDGSMPGACKLPFGEKDENGNIIYELIHTPENMAKFQYPTEEAKDEEKHLASVMYNVTYVTGSEKGKSLMQEYKRKVETILSSGVEETEEVIEQRAIDLSMGKEIVHGKNIRQERAIKLLQIDIAKYDTKIDQPDEEGKLYDVKKEIYRLPNTLIDGLALYLGLTSSTGWERIDELSNSRIINTEAKENLKIILSIAVELRLRTYLASGKQGETISAIAMIFDKPENKELPAEKLEKIFEIPSQEILFRFYYTGLPFRERLKEVFIKGTSKNKNIGSIFDYNDHFLDITNKTKGLIYKRLLRYQEAKICFEQCLQDNPKDEYILTTAAVVYQALGDHKQAIKYYLEALRIREAVFGRKHHSIAATLNNIGNAYGALGDHKQLIKYLQEALEIYKEVSDRKHPDVATTLNNIGNAYGILGDHRQAIKYLQEALEIYEEVFGRKHPDVAMTLHNIGNAYIDLEDHKQAIKYYLEALGIREAVFGRNHPSVAITLNNLGSVYRDLGDHKQAIKYLQEALGIREAVFGRKHPEVAETLNNLGNAYIDLEDHNQSIKYLQEALEIKKAIFGRNHPSVATTLHNIGNVYIDLGDHKQTIKYYLEALGIEETVFGRNHPDVAATLNNLSTVYYTLGDYKQALEYSQEAYNIYLNILGQTHSNTRIAQKNLQRSLIALSKGFSIPLAQEKDNREKTKEQHKILPAGLDDSDKGSREKDTIIPNDLPPTKVTNQSVENQRQEHKRA